jgi:shikimate dehydrogenase
MSDAPLHPPINPQASIRQSAPQVRLGLIGGAIGRSKSPLIHEAEAAAQGLRCTYELIDLDARNVGVDALEGLLAEVERKGFAGVNVTYPCKQAVIPLLHELSDEARAIGAVNTVRLVGGRRIGYNTDAFGFAESVRLGLRGASLENVTQIGAGGAGAAVAYALLGLGATQLTIVDIETGRASALASTLMQRFPERQVIASNDLEGAVATAHGVVNATPIGMAKHPGSAIPQHLLRTSMWVADVVYFPMETELLRDARALGCRTLDGGGMVVFQAARAFEIFTGLTADRDRMRQHFDQIDHG